MKIKFKFPKEVREFVEHEKIDIKELKDKILPTIDEHLLDKNYRKSEYREILIVINGIHKYKQGRVFISSKEISKEKPIRTVSSIGLLGDYSVYYLIYNVA